MGRYSYVFLFACLITFTLGSPARAGDITFHGTGVNSASGQQLEATAHFAVSGNDLVVTLTSIGEDVLVPTDVLTAVFFDLDGDPGLTSTTAVLGPGSTVLFGHSDPGGVVGGEWGYGFGLSGAPQGATQGISSSGFGLFGQPTFPGNNLQGPTALDGMQYGITSAADDSTTGNSQVTGAQALIQSSVVFTLSGLPAGFDPALQVSHVWFQYGTALTDVGFPGNPEEGACCLPTGDCVLVPEADCAQRGGLWWGLGTSCNPNPCPRPVPADPQSWGKIKSGYR